MTKKELTAQVAGRTGLTNVVSLKAIDALFGIIQESLEKGELTTIHGFGTFSVVNRAARVGVSPVTKEKINIPARKAVKFTASKKIVIK